MSKISIYSHMRKDQDSKLSLDFDGHFEWRDAVYKGDTELLKDRKTGQKNLIILQSVSDCWGSSTPTY